MALAMNLPATRVEALVQIPLIGLANVATIFGLISVQAFLLTSKLGVVVGCLLGINLAVRDTTIDAVSLVVDALLNFIDARMTRIRYASSVLGDSSTARSHISTARSARGK